MFYLDVFIEKNCKSSYCKKNALLKSKNAFNTWKYVYQQYTM